jgi:GT2 family glycosyltransferase
MPELSILIVNWNTKDLLNACLESIFYYCRNIIFEVIVVDNHSSDGSRSMMQKKFPSVKVIDSGDNVGFARANNLGLQKTRGKYILFLNPDTRFIDCSLRSCLEAYSTLSGGGFVGCRLLNSDFSFQQSCFPFHKIVRFILANSGLHHLLPARIRRKMNYRRQDFNSIMEVDWMRGAFMFIGKDKLKKIGHFDERLFMYGEDVDICLRARKMGFHNYYYPSTQIIHHENQSGKVFFGGKRLAATFQSNDYVIKKHFGRFTAAGIELVTCITAFVKRFRYPEKNDLYGEIIRINWQLCRKHAGFKST